ncbi:MAG: hypothetical protein H7Y86_04855 [Rhizobacter sp.]|nr:hypothetical protein [Ferruginibacter sp.]
MKKNSPRGGWILLLLLLHLSVLQTHAQTVKVGSGSYTTAFPGTDAAGRNTCPQGSPLTSGDAATRPVRTWQDSVERFNK